MFEYLWNFQNIVDLPLEKLAIHFTFLILIVKNLQN